MRELEVKLSVDEPFVTPPLVQAATGVAGMQELPALDLRATYHDTPDLRLARYGITLRYRSGEDAAGWTLKLPLASVHGLARDELNFQGGARRVPLPAQDLVTAFVRSARLEPVTRLRTRRRRWSLRDGDGSELAELVDDRVSVLQRNRVVARFRELEVEARSLGGRQLEEIARTLEQAGAAPTATPKAMRALGTRALAPPDIVPAKRIAPDEPAAFAVQAAIARSLERIIRNDPGTRLGDAEALHQMRVGTRRLRSDLRTFSSLVDPAWSASIVGEMKQLGGALGEVRDLDVIEHRLAANATGIQPALSELFAELEQRRERARETLLEVLRDRAYVELLDHLVEAAVAPPLAPAAWRPCGDVLPALASKATAKLIRAGGRLSADSSIDRYHRTRILAKRARYAAEAIAPALDADQGRAATRFAERAADVQDALGELQDAEVAGQTIRSFVAARPKDGSACFAAGRLAERQRQGAEKALKRFPKMWRRVRRAAWIPD
jgi:CHAD domain-containing protein